MWQNGKRGTKVFEYKDLSNVAPTFKSRAIYRKDGRFEVTLNVYSDYKINERRSKKAMKDLFVERFGKAPYICICEQRNKLKGKDIYVSSVSFYSILDTMPENCQMEGLEKVASSLMKPI